ncbi:CU044_5270 family protein [Actinosynnema sp. NPDC091369]
MDDLQTLRAALAEDPSPDVVDRSRHRLRHRVRGGHASRKRVGWLTAGAGLTVAAAAAVALTTLPTAPPDGPPSAASTAPDRVASGPEVLLAAATAAERSPEGSGAYWQVEVTVGDSAEVYEYWTGRDGGLWFRGAKTGGRVMPLDLERPKPFSLFGVDLTFGELRALPAEPDALRAWITEAIGRGGARSSAGPFTEEDREMATFHSLVALVSAVPATPGVRAAAFRAIAAYPEVEGVGTVPGGQGLVLPGGRRLVVDPATGRVNGTSVFITVDGAVYSVADPAGARIDARWTDSLPG